MWAQKIKMGVVEFVHTKNGIVGCRFVRPEFLIGNKKAVHRTTYVYQLLMSDGNTCRLPG